MSADHSDFIKAADLVRFWLGRLVEGADVLGEDMDAPVRFPMVQGVEHTSLTHFLERYDEARKALSHG